MLTEAQLHELRTVAAELNMFLAEHSAGKVTRETASPKISAALLKLVNKASDLGVEVAKADAGAEVVK